jgi:galactokinase
VLPEKENLPFSKNIILRRPVMTEETTRALFKKIFGGDTGEVVVTFAPGRVNLIGEHTDYNGGHVFPCAITLGTWMAARLRQDRTFRLYSGNVPHQGIATFSMDHMERSPGSDWADYPKGVVRIFRDAGFPVTRGFDAVYLGDLPTGAGLSSSASIELATATMLSDLFGLGLEDQAGRIRMALLGKETENRFIGVQSGIMDQFAIALGRAGAALFLDCATLRYEEVPLELGDCDLVIMNSNAPRELAGSKYNERREECERALQSLRNAGLAVGSLGELDEATFEAWSSAIEDPICRRRARHAVLENRRTIAAVRLLRRNESGGAERLRRFGALLNASHLSLQFDYDVTGRDLDCLVESAWQQRPCLGARMTGGGFGGCAIALVERSGYEEFVEAVGKSYLGFTGRECTFLRTTAGEGARRIS